MVALAAASLVVLIMVIAILCVKSKSYKYKRKLILIESLLFCQFPGFLLHFLFAYRRSTKNLRRIYGYGY